MLAIFHEIAGSLFIFGGHYLGIMDLISVIGANLVLYYIKLN